MKNDIRLYGVLIFLSLVLLPSTLAFSGSGSGTVGDPYQITTLTQLDEMHDDLAAHYKLMNDIDASATSGWGQWCTQMAFVHPTEGLCDYCYGSGTPGYGWVPLGGLTLLPQWTGSLDGNGKTISNLFINATDGDATWHCAGFDQGSSAYGSGFVGLGSGDIFNLTLDNAESYVDLDYWGFGGFFGYGSLDLTDVVINNSYIWYDDDAPYVGLALAKPDGGVIDGLIIENSVLNVTRAVDRVGGAFGGHSAIGTGLSATYDNVHLTDVTVSAPLAINVGGVIGYTRRPLNTASFIGGSITGVNYVGGIAGYSRTTIGDFSVSTDITASGDYVGGVVGKSTSDLSNARVNSSTVNGNNTVGGIVGETTGDISYVNVTLTDVWAKGAYAGGIVANSSGGDIDWVIYDDGDVVAIVQGRPYTPTDGVNNFVGGIVGYKGSGDISYAYANGYFSGRDYVGGIVGSNPIAGNISYIISEGSIYAEQYTAGFGGLIRSNTSYGVTNVDILDFIGNGDRASQGIYDLDVYGEHDVYLKQLYASGTIYDTTTPPGGFAYQYESYSPIFPSNPYIHADSVYYNYDNAIFGYGSLFGGIPNTCQSYFYIVGGDFYEDCIWPLSPTQIYYAPNPSFPDRLIDNLVDDSKNYQSWTTLRPWDGFDMSSGTTYTGKWFFNGTEPIPEWYYDAETEPTSEYIENVSITPELHEGDTLVGYARWDKGSGTSTSSQLNYTWYKNDVNISSGTTSALARDQSVTIGQDITGVEKGDNYTLSVTSNDYVKWISSETVVVENYLPVTLDARFEIINGTTRNITGYCLASDEDVLDEVYFDYVWKKNTVTNTTGSTYNGTIYSSTPGEWREISTIVGVSPGDSWTIECTARDEYNDTSSNTETYTATIAEAPLMQDVAILPVTADTDDDLQGWCNATSSTANVSYYYTWYLEGVINTTGVSSSYPAGTLVNINNISSNITQSGEEWTLECMAFDGNALSAPMTDSLSVGNANAPVINITGLVPDPAFYDDYLEGYCTASDADGDDLTISHKWYVNGVLINSSNKILQKQAVVDPFSYSGETVTFDNDWSTGYSLAYPDISDYDIEYYLPTDDYQTDIVWEHKMEYLLSEGEPLVRTNISLPDLCLQRFLTDNIVDIRIRSAIAFASGPKFGHTAYAQCNYGSGWATITETTSTNFPLTPNVQYEEQLWYQVVVDSPSFEGGFASVDFPVFDPSLFDGRDIITLECTAFDGANYTSNNVSITVNNTAPVMVGADISPSDVAYTNTSLVGYCNATDVDNENVSYDYIWYKNGVSYLSGTTIGNYSPGTNVAAHALTYTNTDRGDNWIFSCQADDNGVNNLVSGYTNSSPVYISSTPPVLTDASILPVPALLASDLQGWCNATDFDGDDVAYQYNWYKDGALFVNGSVGECYQESPDVDNQTGIDGDCSLSYSGSTSFESAQTDGDWSVGRGYWNDGPGGPINMTYYVNYTIPSDAVDAIWEIKTETRNSNSGHFEYGYEHIDYYPGCFNKSRGDIRIKYHGYKFLLNELAYHDTFCHDGNDWVKMDSSYIWDWNSGNPYLAVSITVYEEAITWLSAPVGASGESKNVANISSSETSNNELWTFSCQPFRQGNYEHPYTNVSVYISDAPYVSNVRIDPPVSPTVFDNLTGYCTGTSNLGEDFYYNYTWYKNGGVHSSGSLPGNYSSGIEQTMSIIDSSELSVLDEWALECTVYNFRPPAPSVNATVLVYNNPPNATNLTISPDPLISGSNAICNWSYFDYEGTAQNGTIVNWYVEGVNVQQETLDSPTSTISSSLFERGDEVICSVTPYDGNSYGDEVNVTVDSENSPPTFSYADLVNDPSTKYDNLICLLQDVYDADGDSTTNYYRFLDTDNVTVLQNWSTDSDMDCEFVGGCQKGDEILCQAYVSDTFSNSTIRNDSVSIINSPPEAQSVYIFPYNPDGTADIECRYTYFDIDSDIESSQTFKWYLNSSSTAFTGQNVSAANVNTGDDWRCEVTVNDGTVDGSPENSTGVGVGSSAPSIILFEGEAGEAQEGQNYTLSWSWTDAQLPVGGPYTHYICYDDNISIGGCGGYELCSIESFNTSLSCEFEVMSWMASTAYLVIFDGLGNPSIVQPLNFDVNHKPNATGINFNVTYNSPNNEYTCSLTGVSDPDTDSTINYYSFYNLNDDLLQSESSTNTFIVGGENDGTHGAAITCKARVYDGQIYSDVLESYDHFRVTSLTITSPVILDEVFNAVAKFNNDTPISGVNISLKSPNNVLYSGLPMDYNNASNQFEYSFSPSILGAWEIYAIYAYEDGDESYMFRGQISDAFVVEEEGDAPPAGGGGGGGGTIQIIELPKVSNITGYCGDSICQDGENPANCWQDCKINYDTLITCIWDEDVDCNYNETWFPTAILILLGSVGLVAIYQYEFANKDKRR